MSLKPTLILLVILRHSPKILDLLMDSRSFAVAQDDKNWIFSYLYFIIIHWTTLEIYTLPHILLKYIWDF